MHKPIVMASAAAIENNGFFVFYLQAFSFSILTFCLNSASFSSPPMRRAFNAGSIYDSQRVPNKGVRF